MKFLKTLAALCTSVLLAGAMVWGVALPASATDPDKKCSESGSGWSAKIDTKGDPATVTVNADPGFLIDAYCVKAGSGNDAVHIISVNPPSASVVIDHPIKDSVSHYQYHQIEKPKPGQPQPDSGTDKGQGEPECVLPLDGTATITSWTQAWTQAYVWDANSWSWVLGAKVYADKVYTTGDPFPTEGCDPPYEEPDPEVVVPQAPVVKDKCGTTNDHYGLPEGPTGITYTRDGKDIIATADEGFELGTLPAGWVAEEGGARYPFSATEWTDEPCTEQPDDKVTPGTWSEPVITCDNEVGDEISISRFDTVTPYKWENDAWVLDTENAETVEVKDVYVVTEADIEALECEPEIPVQPEPEKRATSSTTDPSCETPSTTTTSLFYETPYVWDGEAWVLGEEVLVDTQTVTNTASAEWLEANCAGGDVPPTIQPPLAATGGQPLNPYVPSIAALAVALGIAAITFAVIRNRRQEAAETVRED